MDALPPDYAVYLRTDSVWGTAEPLLDLDATLIAMTSPELQKYRQTYLDLKKSKIRKNFFVKKALKRRLDAAVYSTGEEEKSAVIGVLDAGFLSGAVRLLPYVIPYIKKVSDKLEVASNSHGSFYQFKENTFFVIKKNLVVFSTSKDLLEEAMTFSNSSLYQKNALEAVNARLNDPLRILAHGENLLKLAGSNPDSLLSNYLGAIVPYLSGEEYTTLNF